MAGKDKAGKTRDSKDGDGGKRERKEARKSEKAARKAERRLAEVAPAETVAAKSKRGGKKAPSRPPGKAAATEVVPWSPRPAVRAVSGPVSAVASAIGGIVALPGASALAERALTAAGDVRHEVEVIGEEILRSVQAVVTGIEERQQALQADASRLASHLVAQFRRGLQSQMAALQRRIDELERRAARLEQVLSGTGRRRS